MTAENIEQLRLRCSQALAAYRAASQVIDARLQASESPTDREWLAEESARAALFSARQALIDALAPGEAPARDGAPDRRAV